MSGLYSIQTAFTIWTRVDCYQRRASRYWYLMLCVPFGPLIGAGRPPSLELEDYRHPPRFIQRRDARARCDANALLRLFAPREAR